MDECAIVYLAEPVHSSVDVLRMSYQVVVGSLSAQCVFPHSRGAGPLDAPQGYHGDQNRLETDWGMFNTHSTVTINAFLFKIGWPLELVEGQRLVETSSAIAHWVSLLGDWLAVLADGPTQFLIPGYGNMLWLRKDNDEAEASHRYRQGGWYEPVALSAMQWQYALDRASTGTEAPPARSNLIKAERALAFDDTRNAVLHAATAAEIALVKGLRRCLAGRCTPEEVIEKILSQSRMLGGRIQVAKDLGVTLPLNLKSDLVIIRNHAVHAGRSVSPEEARRAVGVARSIVDTHDPHEEHDPEIQRYLQAEADEVDYVPDESDERH